MAATRLLRVKPVPYPGTFGPAFRKLGNAKNWGVLAKKNFTARELLSESRKSAFVLNWSSWKLDGEEPENSPFACGVGITNWLLGSLALSSANDAGFIAGTSNFDSRVAADRSSVNPWATKTLEEMLLMMAAAFRSREPW